MTGLSQVFSNLLNNAAKYTDPGGRAELVVRREDDGPLAVAGLWETRGEGPDRLVTCCVVTTDAAGWLKPVHDRMPAVLPPESHTAWLSNDTHPGDLLGMLRPYPGEELVAIRVTTAVNKATTDGPECLTPAA